MEKALCCLLVSPFLNQKIKNVTQALSPFYCQ
jgi:hypothetical protein